jgi:hypothetical protein
MVNFGKRKLRRKSRRSAFPAGSWRKHEADVGAIEIVTGYSIFPRI